MIVNQELEERGSGEELRLITHFNTDEEEKLNWQGVQDGKGFIYEEGKHFPSGRVIAQIPAEEAAMLEANYDLDYLAFTRNNDKAAFRRLLKRFPYWRCSSGGV